MYDPFVSPTGPAAHLRGLSQSLSKLGCDVHILVLDSRDKNRDVNGVHVHYHNPFGMSVAKDYIFSQISIGIINRLCRECEIDIVHGQSPSSYGYALLRRSNIPFVVTLHGTSFGEFASYFDVPHSFINPTLVLSAMSEMLFALLTCIEYRRADKVIAVSKATAEETVRFYRLPRERVTTIHNGIDLQSFTDSQVGAENEEHTILSVGRLSWRKGYKYLIDAMPIVLLEYPDARLLLVGNGIQRASLAQQVRKLGVEDSVLFSDKVSTEKLFSLYHEAEVYVQPSLYEPFGITILEAMSMRKPVVATRTGGIPELIKNGAEGLLVEPRNSLQLASAIADVFSDASLRRRLGSNSRKRVEREFTWEAIATKTLKLYTNLLSNW